MIVPSSALELATLKHLVIVGVIALISLVSYTPYSGTPQLNRLRQVTIMLITHEPRIAA
jgi:hypothetical protein